MAFNLYLTPVISGYLVLSGERPTLHDFLIIPRMGAGLSVFQVAMF
ncbi:MAG: hypothetical protein ACU88J_10680 [Gammaproteobacteria bacterium]